MDIDTFWQVIEGTSGKNPEKRAKRLTKRLAALPEADIEDFEVHLGAARARLDTYALWGAASLICDGECSDDSFYYFQAWVIGQGRQAFERVATDPDELATLPAVQQLAGRSVDEWAESEWPDWESLDYVASEAHESRTGQEGSLDEALQSRGFEPVCGSSPEPTDEPWDTEDAAQVAARLPRLGRMFTLSPADARAQA